MFMVYVGIFSDSGFNRAGCIMLIRGNVAVCMGLI